jgi:perosamine synthetase
MVTTNDDRLADRVRLLRNLAFTKPRFWHEEAGYNFRMTGFQAAMGLAQLRRIESIVESKRRMAATYNRHLEGIAGLQLPPAESWARNVYWMYAITVNPPLTVTRDELAARLAAAGIETRTFFCPMNQQPFLRRQAGYREVACPVADRLWQTGLYLPSAHTLREEQIAAVAAGVREALGVPRRS